MAVKRTELLVLVLVLVTKTNCDNDIKGQNETDDINPDVYRDKTQNPMDSAQTDMLLRGSEDEEIRYKDIEPEKSIRDFERYAENENDTENIEFRMTTVEEPTTTEQPDEVNDNLEEEEINKNVESDDKNDEDGVVAATEQIETDGIDNDVIQAKSEVQDSYATENRSISKLPKTDTTTSATTRSMDEMDDFVPRIAELGDDLEITGQRNPKTDNLDPKPPIDKRNFDPAPHILPALTKSETLRSWLSDSWSRPPAGMLVPLRPGALSRALAVWSDLAPGGRGAADLLVLGYDSNGINWRSRHNVYPSSSGNKGRAVSEALSKLLLKYQGVNSDSGIDGTMRALTSAAKLVPYDSALFVFTDKGAGDAQRLPLALRALVEKRLKVYIIWTASNNPSAEEEAELQELRNVSRHTQGDVLPYSLQVMDMESDSNMASEAELQEWDPMEAAQARRGRVNNQMDTEKFETLLVRRGGGQALSLGVSVENGVSALRVYIEGAVEHAVLYPPNDGPQIDLYNVSSVAAFSPSSRIEGTSPRNVLLVFPGVNLETDMLSVIPAAPPKSNSAMVGVWHLSVRCDTCDYRLHVGARAQLHFDVVEDKEPDMLKFRITGPVASVRESVLIDEYGMELAKLPYSYPPITRDPEDTADVTATELTADVKLPNVKGSRVYAKIVGRDTRGEPFVRLAGPLVRQSEVRMGRSAALTLSDSSNDLEAAEEANARVYNAKLEYNDSNVLPYGRAVSQVVNQRGNLLTSVQIGLSSRLYGAPGTNLQLHFEVTNFREQTIFFRFGAVGELNFLRGITPQQQSILPGQTVNVIVDVGITSTAQPGGRDFITFTAYGQEQVSISAYVYVINAGDDIVDARPPDVRHNFQGTCIGRMGDDCAQHVWSATIIARDSVAGLLRLTSQPIGIAYDSNFISGSREEVMAAYRATCCAPRVMVTAVDAFGNTNSYPIDISNYITEAGIAAIVLGVFLGLALIIFIIVLIVWCVRRRREQKELPSMYTSSRNTS